MRRKWSTTDSNTRGCTTTSSRPLLTTVAFGASAAAVSEAAILCFSVSLSINPPDTHAALTPCGPYTKPSKLRLRDAHVSSVFSRPPCDYVCVVTAKVCPRSVLFADLFVFFELPVCLSLGEITQKSPADEQTFIHHRQKNTPHLPVIAISSLCCTLCNRAPPRVARHKEHKSLKHPRIRGGRRTPVRPPLPARSAHSRALHELLHPPRYARFSPSLSL